MRKTNKPQRKLDMRMPKLFFCLAVVAFALGAWAAINGARTLQWPRVPAEIVDAKLTLHERETRDVRRPDQWHTFSVHYLYRIDGKTYLGGRTEPYDLGMQNSAGAVKMARAYPVGSSAPVAYDPNDPGLAYLTPGPSSFSLMLMGIGVAFGLFGLLARRMIRVGPGDPDDDEAEEASPNRTELDPRIADYCPKPEKTQP